MKITEHVSQHDTGLRLDKFVQKIASGEKMTFTRAWIRKLIEQGYVRVNHKPGKPSHRVTQGDIIEMRLKSPEELQLKANRELDVPVLLENKRFLAVNKPAGMPIAPMSHNSASALANFLVAHAPSLARVGKDPLRAGTVHRLDKDTSGIILVAKDNDTHFELSQLFRLRRIIKTYITLVHGVIHQTSDEVDLPLAIAYNARRKRRMAQPSEAPGARDAKTRYTVLERLPDFTLLELTPRTGRFHQIRAHMAAIGHPVVGDKLYGKKLEVRSKKQVIKRQFLHAAKIEFTLFGKHYKIEAPLPKDLTACLQSLRSKV